MANTHSANGHADNPSVRHEESDVNIRAIFGVAAAMMTAAVFIYFGIWLIFGYFERREALQSPAMYPRAAGLETRVPPEPRLQVNPRQDMNDLRAAQDALLGSYGWVDKNAGIVRIPIDEAMKLTVQRGLPTRSGSETRR